MVTDSCMVADSCMIGTPRVTSLSSSSFFTSTRNVEPRFRPALEKMRTVTSFCILIGRSSFRRRLAMSSKNAACLHVFCYGSLRPDDDSGMPWTKDAVAGMRAQPATVSGAKLYEDRYAALVFDDDDAGKRSSTDSKSTRCTPMVVGWVLTTDSPRSFAQKLKDFDQIEGYKERDPESSFYLRRMANVRLGKPDPARGKAVGEEGSMVQAYVYHKPDANKENWIESGDWLQRAER